MRVVLDTNVVVSGLLNPAGPPGRIVDLLLAGDLEPAFDDRIIAEYEAVLRRSKLGFELGDVLAFIDYVRAAGYPTIATPLDLALRDPADAAFIEVALAASADSLVTGNTRHFAGLLPARTLRIESPAQFLRRWRRPHPGAR